MTSMTRMVLSLCSAALLASACAPLAQAPLVYSSKVQGGLSLTSTVADSPGVEITVGYKAVDAAYVPVAVSQPCHGTATSCGTIPIEIITSGDVGILGGKVTDEQLADAVKSAGLADTRLKAAENGLEAAKKTLADADAQTTLKATEKRLGEAQTELEQAKQEQALAEAAAPAADSPPAGAAGSDPVKAAEDKVKAAESKIAGAQQDISLANQKLVPLQAAVARAQEEQAQAADANRNAELLVAFLRDALKDGGTSNRRDAYSVFGSFDTTSTGTADAGPGAGKKKTDAAGDQEPAQGGADTESQAPTPTVSGGVGLRLGKVFSTGLASQNLTDGLRKSAVTSAAGLCFQSAAALIATAPAADKEAMTKQVWAACNAPK